MLRSRPFVGLTDQHLLESDSRPRYPIVLWSQISDTHWSMVPLDRREVVDHRVQLSKLTLISLQQRNSYPIQTE